MRFPESTTFWTYLTLMGFEFEAEVEIEIYDLGTPATGRYGPPEFYDPGSSTDFSITSIILREDRVGSYGPAFFADGELFLHLSDKFHANACNVASAYNPEEDF